jgi:hypothetical protein
MKRKTPSRAFQKALRDIKDADDFVEHAHNIAERYRRELAAASESRPQAMRRSLRTFDKHAVALTQWLKQAQQRRDTPEGDALAKLGAAMYGAPGRALGESRGVHDWLSQASVAAKAQLAVKPSKQVPDAVRVAVEALRATFEHHKLKWSAVVTRKTQSDAVRALCAIAVHAGDATINPTTARQVMLAIAKE